MKQFIDYTLTAHEAVLWAGKDVDSAIFRTATLATARGIADREKKTVLLSVRGEDGRDTLVRTVTPGWYHGQPMQAVSLIRPQGVQGDWQV